MAHPCVTLLGSSGAGPQQGQRRALPRPQADYQPARGQEVPLSGCTKGTPTQGNGGLAGVRPALFHSGMDGPLPGTACHPGLRLGAVDGISEHHNRLELLIQPLNTEGTGAGAETYPEPHSFLMQNTCKPSRPVSPQGPIPNPQRGSRLLPLPTSPQIPRLGAPSPGAKLIRRQ